MESREWHAFGGRLQESGQVQQGRVPSNWGLEGAKERECTEDGSKCLASSQRRGKGEGEVTFLELKLGKRGCLSRKDLQAAGLREGLPGEVYTCYLIKRVIISPSSVAPSGESVFLRGSLCWLGE